MNRRAAAAARGLAAALTLVVLVAGVPLVLYRFGGNPVPRRLPPLHRVTATLMQRDSGALFLGIVRDVSWAAWALFTLAVVTETLAAASGRRAPRLRLGSLQGIAAQLVAVAALTFTGPVSTVLAASTSAPAVLTVGGAGGGSAMTMNGQPAGTIATMAATLASDSPPPAGQGSSMASFQVVVVHPGECLWTIAQHYLGNGDRYPEIAALNTGHSMGGGRVFSDPALIEPGWVLQLPASAITPGPPAPAPVAHHPAHPSRHHHYSQPHQPASPAPSPSASAGGQNGTGGAASSTGPPPSSRPAPGHTGTGRHTGTGHHAGTGHHTGPGRHASPGSTDGSGTGTDRTGTDGTGSSGTASRGAPAGQQDEVPPLAVFAAGMLAGGVVVSLSRMRHRQRQARRPGRRIPMPSSAPVLQAEQRLRTAPPLQPATALRVALAELGAGLATSGQQLPDVAGVHLTESAMELLLAAPASQPPPPPFTIPGGRQGMAWLLPLPGYELPAGVSPDDGDLLPGLLTAGATDGGGYLLVDLEHLRVTTVDGPAELVSRVMATAAAELAVSELAGWYDLILCGYSELEVTGGRATSCDSLDEALDMLAAKAVTLQRRLGDGGVADVRYRRVTEPDDEDWSLSLLVSKFPPSEAQLAFLTDISSEPGGIAALVAAPPGGADGSAGDDGAGPSRFALSPDPARPGGITGRIAPLQLEIHPQALTAADYDAIVSLFETAAEPGDVPPGRPPYDGSAWTEAATPAGGQAWGAADPDPGRSTEQSWDPSGPGWQDPVPGWPDSPSRADEDQAQLAEDRPQLADDPGVLAGQLALLNEDAALLAEDPVQVAEDPVQLAEDPVQLNGDPDQRTAPAQGWPGEPSPGGPSPAHPAGSVPPWQLDPGPVWPADEAHIQEEDPDPVQQAEVTPGWSATEPAWASALAEPAAPDAGTPPDPAHAPEPPYGPSPPYSASPPYAAPASLAPPAPQAATGPAENVPADGAPADRVPAAGPSPVTALRIGILGSFTINGAAGALLPAQSQLILALALNGAVGLSNPQLGYLLGADPDHPKPSDSLRQLITRTRRQLGPGPAGREWIVHLGGGQYALHPDARFDWAEFSLLAEHGLAGRNPADLRAALSLVRGQPFTGCYQWWLDLAFVETVRAQIVDTADLLAGLELAAGNPSASARAARAGLAGDVAAEQLWRALMRAEHATGNLSGVREAWTHCLAVIADIAPDGEPHPDTAELYRELLRHAGPLTARQYHHGPR